MEILRTIAVVARVHSVPDTFSCYMLDPPCQSFASFFLGPACMHRNWYERIFQRDILYIYIRYNWKESLPVTFSGTPVGVLEAMTCLKSEFDVLMTIDRVSVLTPSPLFFRV